MNLIGEHKSINEQIEILKQILLQNKKLSTLLKNLQDSDLKNYYVGAGSINQTVFNYYHDFDLDYGIKDFDIVYFDEDTSYEKEDKVIRNISSLIENINIEVDIKNEARVHLWYKDKFGFDIKPYTSVEEAIRKWGTTVTCIGVRLENDKLVVFAPYGLNDVFGLIIRPIKENFNKYHYDIKVERWLNTWPKLKVIKWND
ncbi:MAG: nucleotidyltransferase family protein [Bacilli bacterium]|nr:nucleotidyltransferase family protein [Bacilli bacterium]MDD4718267.1 nucleotidyltransferase family protein [Bacilli bacterium]